MTTQKQIPQFTETTDANWKTRKTLGSADVNPLSPQSSSKINNVDENRIVVVTRNGEYKLLGRHQNLGLIEKLMWGVKTHYEVDPRPHRFELEISSPTNEASLYYTIFLTFELKVIDPCKIVEQKIGSMLDCVKFDLTRLVMAETTARSFDESKLVFEAIRLKFEDFKAPDYLSFKPGPIQTHLPPAALEASRQKELRNLTRSQAAEKNSANIIQAVAEVAQKGVDDHVGSDIIGKLVDSSVDHIQRIGTNK